MPSVMERAERSGGGVLSRSRAKTVTNGNSHHSEEESRDEEHAHDSKIRVGGDYQAQIPEFKPDSPARYSDKDHRSMLVWCPNSLVSDAMLDEYILVSKEKHGYNMEQSLGILLWYRHDVERSLAALANFTPFSEEWSVEDKVLFEQAFSFHGKSFHRIQQMLPDKLVSSLVKYYYSWKKTRTRTSVMDRQARRLVTKRDKEDRTPRQPCFMGPPRCQTPLVPPPPQPLAKKKEPLAKKKGRKPLAKKKGSTLYPPLSEIPSQPSQNAGKTPTALALLRKRTASCPVKVGVALIGDSAPVMHQNIFKENKKKGSKPLAKKKDKHKSWSTGERASPQNHLQKYRNEVAFSKSPAPAVGPHQVQQCLRLTNIKGLSRAYVARLQFHSGMNTRYPPLSEIPSQPSQNAGKTPTALALLRKRTASCPVKVGVALICDSAPVMHQNIFKENNIYETDMTSNGLTWRDNGTHRVLKYAKEQDKSSKWTQLRS